MQTLLLELLVILRHPLVLLGIVCFFVWLLLRSPALRWTAKLALLIAWGAMTLGAVLFVISAIYIPRWEYSAALAELLAGSFICFFWIALGLPELWKTLRAAKGGLKLWEKA
jgi:uncharacterized membrane protein